MADEHEVIQLQLFTSLITPTSHARVKHEHIYMYTPKLVYQQCRQSLLRDFQLVRTCHEHKIMLRSLN